MQESCGAQYPDWQVLAAGDEQGHSPGQFLRHGLEEARPGAQAGNQHLLVQDQPAESAAAHCHVPGESPAQAGDFQAGESEPDLQCLSTTDMVFC